MRAIAVAVVILTSVSPVSAQPTKPPQDTKPVVSMERYQGTSVATDLGHGIVLNKGSSLKREWFVVRDDNSPASIIGKAGIFVIYEPGGRSSLGEYQYQLFDYKIKVKEPIVAFEIRLHVLDVFGRLLRTLSSTELADVTADTKKFNATWRIWTENEASRAFVSIAYVAQVRTAAGRVYEANPAAVFDQVRGVAKRITEADLEPTREPATK